GLESVSQDSSYSIIVKSGDSCVHEIKNLKGVISWTEHNEDHLRASISKTLNDTAVCDCYISKLRSKYPDGVPISLTHSETRAMVKQCDSEIKETKQGQDRIIKLMKK
ncbi:MAG TPA: hypothetical protein VHS53_07290, partial [Mucilaginibacter sp.]|nr:hypothetical protein [Mucilaginibacter sp.]